MSTVTGIGSAPRVTDLRAGNHRAAVVGSPTTDLKRRSTAVVDGLQKSAEIQLTLPTARLTI